MQLQVQFDYVVRLINGARHKAQVQAYQVANRQLVDLYWNVGEYLHQQVQQQDWGKAVIQQLADYIKTQHPNVKGFSSQNLWRMKQFYETYKDDEKLSTLWRELSWSHNRRIMGCDTTKEREFYIRLCMKERLSFRELDRQINSSYYERVMLGNAKLDETIKALPQSPENIFKDTYVLEMLDLSKKHDEKDLKHKISQNIRKFLLEFGRDFAFMGEEYPLQVGNQDFAIDLLFYNRSLQCLVAIELKIERFKPAHLGQLNFYLEALDRDIKTPHENPSIGILLCKGKDDTVVEYALSRNASPTLVADYKVKLPKKALLKAKWEQLLEQLGEDNE